MAVLITGLGYIGATLAQRLLAQDQQVVGVENFFSTAREMLADLGTSRQFSLVEGSTSDRRTLEAVFARAPIDTVFHLAAQASTHPDAAPAEYTERTNFAGTRLVLEACAAHRVRRVVLASSTRLYAVPLPRRISERSSLSPPDSVHLSHLYGELLLAELAGREPGWSPTLVAARLGTVHGVGPVLKTDPRFLAVPQLFCLQAAQGKPLRVATGPSAVLALVHLDDAVEGLIRCAALPPGVQVANVASEVRSVSAIADGVSRAAREQGIEVQIDPLGDPAPEPGRTVTSALRRVGFRPRRRIDHSLGSVLDHYLARAKGTAPSPQSSPTRGEGV